jgi:exoribonuclease II
MMNGDLRILNSLYRQQISSGKSIDQIGVDAENMQGMDDAVRLFEQLNEEKSKLVNNFAVSTTYLSYKHETIKSAINVV